MASQLDMSQQTPGVVHLQIPLVYGLTVDICAYRSVALLFTIVEIDERTRADGRMKDTAVRHLIAVTAANPTIVFMFSKTGIDPHANSGGQAVDSLMGLSIMLSCYRKFAFMVMFQGSTRTSPNELANLIHTLTSIEPS